MSGFVYILSNPAFPELLKIGKSSRDPVKYRAPELSQTGVPEPFKVEYYAYVDDENILEAALHQYFDQQRTNRNREFFKIDLTDAIITTRYLAYRYGGIKFEEKFFQNNERWCKLLDGGWWSDNEQNKDILRRELTRWKSVDGIRNERNETPFEIAIEFCSIKSLPSILEIFLSVKMDINEKFSLGGNALSYISNFADVEEVDQIIQHLLDLGADLHSIDTDGMTALHYAVGGGPKRVRCLIESGAVVDAKDHAGNTPLLRAAFNRGCNVDVFTTLIQFGADICAKNLHGDNVLSNLCKSHRRRHVSDHQHLQIMLYLLKSGADIRNVNNENENLLHLLFQNEFGNPDLIELMLFNGVNHKDKNNAGKSALDIAISKPSSKLSQRLFELVG